jgi:hypothetical protein
MCPHTYNNNSRHVPLWLPKGGANALHLITNNLPWDLGATPSPSLWCFVGDGVTSLASSLSDKAGGNGHFADGMPARQQPSSPTSRHSPYYEGMSSLGSRHYHSSTTATGAYYAFEHSLRWDAPSSFHSLRSDVARGTNGHVIEGRSDTLSTCLHQAGHWEQCSAPVRLA